MKHRSWNRRDVAWFDGDQPFTPALTVYEPTPAPIDTGLLDAAGTKIFRRQTPETIGFVLAPKAKL